MDEPVVIKFVGDISGLDKSILMVNKAIQNFSNNINTSISNIKMPKLFGNAGKGVFDPTSSNNMRQAYFDSIYGGLNRVGNEAKKLNSMQVPFAGWAMSIMFFGMALQRMFDTVWKSGTKTFQDVMHSVEGNVTQFDILNGSIAYLQFNIGQALEPIVDMIIPIIDIISEWILQNEGLTRTIVSTVGIVGAIAAFGGAMVLARNGISEFLMGLGLIKTQLSSMQALQIGVGLYLALDSFENFKDGEILAGVASALESAGFMAMVAGKDGVSKALVGVGIALQIVDVLTKSGGKLTPNSLADLLISIGGLSMFVFPPAGAALLTIGVGLKLLPDDFKDKFVGLMGILFGLLTTLIAGLFDVILAPMKAVVNELIKAYNFITGSTVETISYTSLTDNAWNRTKELIDEFNTLTTPQYAPTTDTNMKYTQDYYTKGNPQSSDIINNYYLVAPGYETDRIIAEAERAGMSRGVR